MAKVKPKQVSDDAGNNNYLNLWETQLKPNILMYYQVPLEVVAATLGISVNKVKEQLRSGLYSYGIARLCPGGQYTYEVYPLWLVNFVEGNSTKTVNVNYADTPNQAAMSTSASAGG